MPSTEKPIRLSAHARAQLVPRGASETEVTETIRTAEWTPAELGKLECRKEFAFNQIWNGKHYGMKQVKPIFAEETGEIVVVTVYVYYY